MDPQVSAVRRPAWAAGLGLKREAERAVQAISRHYLVFMLPMSLLVLFLNYHAQGMQGVVPNYEDFKRIILAGFDPKAGIYGTPTFPMWGYGWLLLLTESKTALLLLQHGLALWAVWIFVRFLEARPGMPQGAVTLLKGLLVGSLPWYAFHSLRWPYSVAISLFLVSCVLLVEAMSAEGGRPARVATSGILFGLALNFRSDYLWMPILFGAIVVAWGGWRGRVLKHVALWLAAAYLLLVPWALYARRATGQYLLASTNAGHVLFIGLGNLPGNKWGIVPEDGDPVMTALIQERFGARRSSLLYDTDRFLRGEFLRRVLEDPREYLRKVMYAFESMVRGGVYGGEFFERPECRPMCFIKYLRMRERLLSNPTAFLAANGLAGGRVALQSFSSFMGRWVVFLAFVLLPAVAALGWKQRNLLLLLVSGGIAYQAALNSLAFNMASYSANMYFFYLISLSVGVAWLGSLLGRQPRGLAGK